jgi:hypothetical protein
MAERAAIEAVMKGEPSAPPPPIPPSGASLPQRGPRDRPPVFCVKCAADVSVLPPAARFCNRCGAALPERLGHAARYPGAQSSPPPLPPEPFQPPLILLAYAKALFNLGWRYETAVGSRRNLEEAARCYWKAARLGDAAARGRFGPGADHSCPLPCMLPAEIVVDSSPPFATVYRPPFS